MLSVKIITLGIAASRYGYTPKILVMKNNTKKAQKALEVTEPENEIDIETESQAQERAANPEEAVAQLETDILKLKELLEKSLAISLINSMAVPREESETIPGAKSPTKVRSQTKTQTKAKSPVKAKAKPKAKSPAEAKSPAKAKAPTKAKAKPKAKPQAPPTAKSQVKVPAEQQAKAADQSLELVRKLQWTGTTTDFLELFYALYESRQIKCIGPKHSKKIYMESLGEYFGIAHIDTHSSKHSKHISQNSFGDFLKKLYYLYIEYVRNLHDKNGLKYCKS